MYYFKPTCNILLTLALVNNYESHMQTSKKPGGYNTKNSNLF